MKYAHVYVVRSPEGIEQIYSNKESAEIHAVEIFGYVEKHKLLFEIPNWLHDLVNDTDKSTTKRMEEIDRAEYLNDK